MEMAFDSKKSHYICLIFLKNSHKAYNKREQTKFNEITNLNDNV